ncbi:hypothetical protein F511_35182 [Dorcoceras hygrometricum]|uniref:Uncharacterized protein n=1 Tax=Dorcoceras hygrometricum TaxID=472368 RepID=A0A2Z7ADX7_9LAMI|nr:hypothetical protein F511_35182 [Dorcoceras hygrometricum]
MTPRRSITTYQYKLKILRPGQQNAVGKLDSTKVHQFKHDINNLTKDKDALLQMLDFMQGEEPHDHRRTEGDEELEVVEGAREAARPEELKDFYSISC